MISLDILILKYLTLCEKSINEIHSVISHLKKV